MCLADVRIGRNKDVEGTATVQPDDTTPARLFTKNVRRATVIVVMRTTQPITDYPTVVVRAGSSAGPVLAALNYNQPSVILNIQDYGELVQDELWVTADAPTLGPTEATALEWRITPEDQ